MNGQQKYIKILQDATIPEVKVAKDIFKDKVGKYSPGKRYKLDTYNWHDERTVCLNEIVFDLDWNSYVRNYAEAKKIIDVLVDRGIEPYVCATGGKGIHIHLFFNKLKFERDEHKKLIKEAFSYGLKWKHIRLWFWNLILDEAGIEKENRGQGKPYDSFPLCFDYYAGTSRLIRDIGGKKHIKKQDGTWQVYYKTYIPLNRFGKNKPNAKNISDVIFPREIKTFNINEYDLADCLKHFIDTAKKTNIPKLSNIRINTKYIELDSVLKIREGLDTGQRSVGALLISIASKIDKLPKKDAIIVLEEYVNNCSQIGHKFTLPEAQQWMDWIYSQNDVYWNCGQLKELGVHNEYSCEYCRAQHRESLKFLKSSTILKQINDVLDELVVGEGHNKMLIFLLLLSKDFPSETGLLGWNIPGDPFSQNIILSADSASGKTYILKQILKLFGDEDVDYYVISRITKSAFNYFTEENMDGKIIFIEELQGLDEHTEQLRVWMSEGKLSLTTVEKIKNEEGIEKLAKETKNTKGQPCFVTCQAESIVGEQLLNRSWVLSTDVTEIQSQKILNYQCELAQGKIKFDTIKLQIIKDAIKQLKPYHFIIPFADYIEMNIPTKDVRVRRDFTKFLNLIRTSAHLHQKQRHIIEKDGKEFIICSIQDYEIAKQYSEGILGATFSGLTNTQIDVLNFIKIQWPLDDFTVADLQRHKGKSVQHWHGMLKQLVDLGYLNAEGDRGRPTYFTLVKQATLNLVTLPEGKMLEQKIETKKNEKKEK
ncbi:MAG: hypothetical protein Unbinned1693contig1002_24 [Prokaryotic dsDNA virus sp.]|jgi:hypothetical protein|nr:MAG: hypothetical protein Unbinned1693contig1002_24 [Prokaryotic dsDNA virus sp.]|tara:strand:+ start:147 stop:2441 length:2295 start_codon:yes stop_codon:yes gene_type:complete